MIHTSSGDRILSPQSQAVSKSRHELDLLTPQPGLLQKEAVRTGAVLCGHHGEERRTGHEKAGRGLTICTETLRAQQQQGGAGKESGLLRRHVLLERRT